MALTRDVYQEIGRHLPLASLGQLSRVAREARITPTLDLCCISPTRKEIVDYVMVILDKMKTADPTDEDFIFDNTIEYRQAGLIFEIQPNFDFYDRELYPGLKKENSIAVHYDGELIKRLYTRKQIESYLLKPRLLFNDYNIRVYVDILKRREGCLSIPNYISTCVLEWLKREVASTIRGSDINADLFQIDDIFQALEDFSTNEERIIGEEIVEAFDKIQKELRNDPRYFIRGIAARGETIPNRFTSEGEEILMSRTMALLDTLSPEDFDFEKVIVDEEEEN